MVMSLNSLPSAVFEVRTVLCFTYFLSSGSDPERSASLDAFATETQINKIASLLGMSPIAIRRKNAVVSGTKTITGQILNGVGFTKTLDAIEPIYEERRRALSKETQKAGRKRELGVASLAIEMATAVRETLRPRAWKLLRTERSLPTAAPRDIGTGSDTALAQITADAAGVNIGRIQVVSGDSTKTE